MPYKEIDKRRECRRRWYSENKRSEKDHVSRRKNEIRSWFKNFKLNLKCSECGEDHPSTIDFHHSSKNKEAGVSMMVANGYSIERIKIEISKCIVLCAN